MAAIKVIEPKIVNISGLMKINVKLEDKSGAGIRVPFSLSIPTLNHTAKIGII